MVGGTFVSGIFATATSEKKVDYIHTPISVQDTHTYTEINAYRPPHDVASYVWVHRHRLIHHRNLEPPFETVTSQR